jgi:hypothetical protein
MCNVRAQDALAVSAFQRAIAIWQATVALESEERCVERLENKGASIEIASAAQRILGADTDLVEARFRMATLAFNDKTPRFRSAGG